MVALGDLAPRTAAAVTAGTGRIVVDSGPVNDGTDG